MGPTPKAETDDPVLAAVARWLDTLSEGERIAVGCSGGLDSIALLDALARVVPKRRTDLQLVAHHVHHGLLPEADHWCEQVREFCAGRGIAFTTERVSVDRDDPAGIEAAARRARYASLAGLPVEVVALAHHADDQAETVLLQLLRGGTPRGLAGMPATRVLIGPDGRPRRLERPLLSVARPAIAAYARARRLPWAEDPSNRDPRHARARVRTRIWPALLEAFPDARDRLASAAREQAEAVELLAALADADLALIGEGSQLSLIGWAALSPLRRRLALRRWIERHGIDAPRRAATIDWERQLMQAAQARANHVRLQVGGPDASRRTSVASTGLDGWEIRVHRGEAKIIRTAPVSCADRADALPATLQGPGRWSTAAGELRADLISGCATVALRRPASDGEGWRVRTRQSGDRLRLSERSGRVMLKKIFEAHGIPVWQRADWPVVCDGDQVIAVAGLAVDPRYRCDAGLSLRWEPCEARREVAPESQGAGDGGKP